MPRRHAAAQGAEVGGRRERTWARDDPRRGAKELDECSAQPRRLDAECRAAPRGARSPAAFASCAVGSGPAKQANADEGVLVFAPFGRGEVYVSGAATTETAAFANTTAGLSDAMKTLTVARFGRHEKFDSMADEAVQTAMRVTKDQQSAHSLLKEWSRSFSASVVDLRKKVWS
jgi:hypothetical protein